MTSGAKFLTATQISIPHTIKIYSVFLQHHTILYPEREFLEREKQWSSLYAIKFHKIKNNQSALQPWIGRHATEITARERNSWSL